MRLFGLTALLAGTLLCAVAFAAEGEAGPLTQKTCPIMKEAIDARQHADLHGHRVYFCCKACIKKFQEEPGKSLRALEEMGEKPQRLGKPQSACPLTGHPISGRNFGVVDGARVDFCCDDCEKKFDAMARADKLAVVEKMVKAGQVPTLLTKEQTTCPVMDGGKVDKKAFVDLDGERTYFCCPGCKEKYTADKARYDKQLAAKGVRLERAPGEKKPS